MSVNSSSDKQTITMHPQDKGHKKRFIVTCQETCQDVKIELNVESGDPDLFAFDQSQPTLTPYGSCKECHAFCNSYAGSYESCDISSTTGSSFYVLVYALSAYGNGDIVFQNVLNVEQYGNFI